MPCYVNTQVPTEVATLLATGRKSFLVIQVEVNTVENIQTIGPRCQHTQSQRSLEAQAIRTMAHG